MLFNTCCLKEEHESPSSSFISPTYIQHLHIAIIPPQLSAPACVHRAGPCGQPLMAASPIGDPPPGTHRLQDMLAIEMRKHAWEIGQGRRWGISNVGAQRRPVVPPAPREGPQNLQDPSYWRFHPHLPLAQFPGWMGMRDGQEYCLICGKYATDQHLVCENHVQRQRRFEAGPWDVTDQFISQGGSGTLGVGASVPDLAHGHIAQSSEEAPRANAWEAWLETQRGTEGSLPELAVPSLPAAWGDRHFYTYFPTAARWYCRLCWRYADDVHVLSQKHEGRALIPEVFGVFSGEPNQRSPPPDQPALSPDQPQAPYQPPPPSRSQLPMAPPDPPAQRRSVLCCEWF